MPPPTSSAYTPDVVHVRFFQVHVTRGHLKMGEGGGAEKRGSHQEDGGGGIRKVSQGQPKVDQQNIKRFLSSC